MRLVFSLSFFLLLLADSLSQSTNDILNLLIANKTISQSQADSIRADAALLQQQIDASRKSFFITAARQMQLAGYSYVLGANYNFNNWSRLQAFYTIRQEEGPAVKNNFLSVQYQIGF